MAAAYRLGDPSTCGDVMASGSGNVFVNGMPISRVGIDNTAGHCYPSIAVIPYDNPTAFANNIAVVRVGDIFPTHCCDESCHQGVASVGSPDVFVNS